MRERERVGAGESESARCSVAGCVVRVRINKCGCVNTKNNGQSVGMCVYTLWVER